nr:MAG TPA: hypothetical protein [Caudoviricetes sp.]
MTPTLSLFLFLVRIPHTCNKQKRKLPTPFYGSRE